MENRGSEAQYLPSISLNLTIMNLCELIEQLEKLREQRGDLIQVVLRTKNGDEKTWCRNFVITIWEEESYCDEISIQNFKT